VFGTSPLLQILGAEELGLSNFQKNKVQILPLHELGLRSGRFPNGS
jgi:hypothetical protein